MTSQKSPLRVAIYARISADTSGEAIGVTDQARLCRELIAERFPEAEISGPGCRCRDCTRFGVAADIYCDNDISASGKKQRPHYEQLTASIKAGRIDAVVSVDTDRLHRNIRDLLDYMDVCEPRNIPTYTVKSGRIDLSTPGGRAFAVVGGTFARYEWEQMVARQKAAKQRARDAGVRQGGSRPFGYQLDERDHNGRQIPGVSRGLVVDEREAEAVRQVYARFLAGESLYSIARYLGDAGFRTPKSGKRGGHAWQTISIRRLLTRGLYAGLVQVGGEVTGPALWEPIISEETWRASKALLENPGRRTSPGPKPANLLTGVLVCGVCGKHYFRSGKENNKRGGARIYVCASGYSTGKPCMAIVRNQAALDAYIETIIIERLSLPDVVDALNERPGVDIVELEGKRNGLRARLDELGAAYAAHHIDMQQMVAASKPLREQITEAEKALSDAYRGTALEEFAGTADATAVWDGLPIERQRAVAKLLLRVVLKPKSGSSNQGGTRGGSREDLIEITHPDGTPWGKQ